MRLTRRGGSTINVKAGDISFINDFDDHAVLDVRGRLVDVVESAAQVERMRSQEMYGRIPATVTLAEVEVAEAEARRLQAASDEAAAYGDCEGLHLRDARDASTRARRMRAVYARQPR